MRSDIEGAKVWFDPIGVLVEPETTIRWIIRENVHTTTAYHPENNNHALRIPSKAKPWDSGYMVNPGDQFEVTLTIPGVYDYYCAPHEEAGMVGRIIVARTSGSDPDLFENYGAQSPDREAIPSEAQKAFPSIEEIMRRKSIEISA